MILTNIETVPGKKIVEHFGVISGSTVRAKHIGRDFMASLKNIVGGFATSSVAQGASELYVYGTAVNVE